MRSIETVFVDEESVLDVVSDSDFEEILRLNDNCEIIDTNGKTIVGVLYHIGHNYLQIDSKDDGDIFLLFTSIENICKIN